MFTTFENKLSEKGFEKFAQEGDIFDPNIHEGLGTVKTEDDNMKNKIAQVIMNGYKYKGLLYRPAKVKIYE
ncbi:MAG: nucleotide exchange factor GrpE [Cyanobium sp. MAG06]|nr:nucleotide exchange factor GrpE [Cyanobium sp. MAG06]